MKNTLAYGYMAFIAAVKRFVVLQALALNQKKGWAKSFWKKRSSLTVTKYLSDIAPGACIIKYYEFTMHRLRSKLVCLSILVKVTDDNKDTSFLCNMSIFLHITNL